MVLQWLFPRLLYFPSLLWNTVRESADRKWYDRIDSFVLLGALPFKHHIKELVEKQNVRGVISVNESYETRFFTFSVKEWESYGVEHMHLDVGEYFFAPSRLQITAALEMIDRHKKMNHSVYVHCKAGRGRSASVVACYLIKDRHMSPQEALELLKMKRPQVKLTECQWEAVRDFTNGRQIEI